MRGLVSSVGLLATRTFYSVRCGSGRFVVPGLVVVLLAISALVSWMKWGAALTQRPEYLLAAERVEVTPQPNWIQADVKAEVIRDGMLSDVGVLDTDVTVKVAQAFELHTWVSSVKRVSKSYPGKIHVELVYRKPIAMVEVYAGDKRWLLPVDDQAVLLPGEDFSRKQAQNYLRIATGNVAATGPAGTRWDDSRVSGAVRIAKTLNEHWKEMGLYRIALIPHPNQTTSYGSAEYTLQTRTGQRIIWGHAPGDERPGEASAHQKLTSLVEFVRKNGALGGQSSSSDLDLREGIATPLTRTAQRP